MLLPIEKSDIVRLKEIQPPDWENIQPHFQFYLDSKFCLPLKIELDSEIVAIGSIIYHYDTAWLAHIITHPDHRNKGLGTQMTAGLVEAINQSKYPTVYLIATDLGYPVYKKLGFELEGLYNHLKGEKKTSPIYTNQFIQPTTAVFLEQLNELDQKISGENRRAYFAKHLPSALIYIQNGILQGAYFPKLLDGYIMATNDVAGIALMRERIKDHDLAILPEKNDSGIEFLKSQSFEIVRTSRRMHLGPSKAWKPEHMYNRISGQIG